MKWLVGAMMCWVAENMPFLFEAQFYISVYERLSPLVEAMEVIYG